MNMIAATSKAVSETMSSREIAEMYAKPHNDVLKKIRVLEVAYLEAFGAEGNFSHGSYLDANNQERPEILLNKSQALFVASRFDAVLHARVQKRWEDLEAQTQAMPFQIDGNFMIRIGEEMKAKDQKINLLENKVEVIEQKIEEQKPKVIFAEALEISTQTCLVSELAKLLKQNGYDIGQNRLFEWLRNKGYLIKQRGEMWNQPTQRSMELKLFEVKTSTNQNSDGSVRVNRTTKVTTKGQSYFINKLCPKKEEQ